MNYKPTACQQTGQAQGDYRFTLEQTGKKMLFVIGLNPSTADESRPDRTVNRIMGFVEGGGYDGFVVFNLSAERSTDKWSLAPQLDADKHRRNLDAIRKVAELYPSADILAAWGNDINIRPYLKQCAKDISDVLQAHKGRWLQIGKLTVKGNPRHPLYAKYDWGLQAFDMIFYLQRLH